MFLLTCSSVAADVKPAAPDRHAEVKKAFDAEVDKAKVKTQGELDRDPAKEQEISEAYLQTYAAASYTYAKALEGLAEEQAAESEKIWDGPDEALVTIRKAAPFNERKRLYQAEAEATRKNVADYYRMAVLSRLKRMGKAVAGVGDAKRIELFKSDPAESYTKFCTDLIGRLNRSAKERTDEKGNVMKPEIRDDFKADLKKTDSLTSPYAGTLLLTRDTHVTNQKRGLRYKMIPDTLRLTVVAENKRWVIKDVEEQDLREKWGPSNNLDFVRELEAAFNDAPNP